MNLQRARARQRRRALSKVCFAQSVRSGCYRVPQESKRVTDFDRKQAMFTLAVNAQQARETQLVAREAAVKVAETAETPLREQQAAPQVCSSTGLCSSIEKRIGAPCLSLTLAQHPCRSVTPPPCRSSAVQPPLSRPTSQIGFSLQVVVPQVFDFKSVHALAFTSHLPRPRTVCLRRLSLSILQASNHEPKDDLKTSFRCESASLSRVAHASRIWATRGEPQGESQRIFYAFPAAL